jgi:hypothetical protein
VVADDVGVAVPAHLVVHSTRVDLDEAHAALDHPSREQALAREVGASGIIEAVEGLDLRGLLVDRQSLRRGRLHAVGELEALDARSECIVGGAGRTALIERGDDVELASLLFGRHAGRAFEVVDRLTLRP